MKKGDWLITIGKKKISIGQISGDAYIEKTPMYAEYDADKNISKGMVYGLRRKISWGPSMDRKNLPHGLQMSLQAHQAVFNIDSHWDTIYHTLYPFFMRNEVFYCSARVRSEQDVSSLYLANYLSFLSELEVISKEYENIKSISDFEKIYSEYLDKRKITLAGKVKVQSPGEIWNHVKGIAGPMSDSIAGISPSVSVFLIGYAMLFGNKLLGMDGIIDKESRHKIFDVVLDVIKHRIEQSRADQSVERLNMIPPTFNNTQLEDASEGGEDELEGDSGDTS